jgi:hypothetical protein
VTGLLAVLAAVAHVQVTCAVQLPIRADAVYDIRNEVIILRQDDCERLQLLQAGARPRNQYRQQEFAQAVWLFAHEWAHARGVPELSPETDVLADCTGMRTMGRVSAALGVRPEYAEVLHGYAQAALYDECG